MSLVTGWNALPGELHLQILSYLDPTSIMCFAATDKANRLLAQDEWLCEQLCRGHYPLAAARKSQEEVAQRATEPWYKKIVNTSVSRKCIISRRSLDYYQLAHYNGLRPRYAEDVGIRPRRQFSKYNFGRLVLYYKKVEVFLLVNLVTRRSTEYVLPSSVLIHDIHLEEDYIYVLTVGLPFRHIFKFDMKGNLIRKLDTKRNDLEWIMANQRHIVVYARNSRRWVPYPVEMDETFPDEDAQLHIPFTALSDFDTYAMDERYFYQLDEETGVLLIYDLDNHYLVSRISMFPRHKELMRIEVVSINRHSYVFGPDKLCLMNGLDMTKVAIPGIRNDGGGPGKAQDTT